MSLDVLKAHLEGYADHLFDLQLLGVQQGYWAGYYGNAKKPKPVSTVLREMLHKHSRTHKKRQDVVKPEVDMDYIMAQEKRLKQMRKH